MSQSPSLETTNESGSQVRRYQQGWRALNRLLHEDFSFSGQERHCAMLNVGRGESFATISSVSGLDFSEDGRAVATADWDYDGDLDLWITARTAPRLRLMKNQQDAGNNFVSLRVIGNGTTTNRDGVGARLELYSDASERPQQIKTVRAGDAFLSQASLWINFGLGKESAITRVVVRWPGGAAEQFTAIEANGFFLLRQGSGTAQRWNPPAQPTLVVSPQTPHRDEDEARIVLPFKLPLPRLRVAGATAGEEQQTLPQPTQPTLINIWSSDCVPCLEELNEWAQRATELAPLHVIMLNTDRLAPGASVDEASARAKQLVAQLELPFELHFASQDAINSLDCFQRGIMDRWRTLSVPSSFLVDKDGCVSVIYRGPASVDQIAKDIGLLDASAQDRVAAGLPFAGRSVFGVPTAAPLLISQQLIDRAEVRLATEYLKQYTDFAATYFRDQTPTSVADVNYVLGVLLVEQKQRKSGFEHLQRAAKINPSDIRVRRQLGELLLQAGRFADAESHLRITVESNPRLVSIQQRLMICLLQQKKYDAAAVAGLKAIELFPDDAQLHYHCATALRHLEDWQGTVREYERVIELEPRQALAANNLAWILATHNQDEIRNANRALALARQICEETKFEQPLFLDTLAVALAATGSYDKAAKVIDRAMEMATKAGAAKEKLDELKQRRELFQKEMPYRMP